MYIQAEEQYNCDCCTADRLRRDAVPLALHKGEGFPNKRLHQNFRLMSVRLCEIMTLLNLTITQRSTLLTEGDGMAESGWAVGNESQLPIHKPVSLVK